MASTNADIRWKTGLAYGLPTFASLVHSLYFLPRTVDDMFIYLRYAENAAAGHGLVYNLGERVEGFSGPFWLFLLTVGEWLGLGGVSWSKALGLLSLAALVGGVVHLGRQLRLPTWAASVAGLLVAANSYIVSWSVMGLETPLHLAGLVWGAGCLVDESKRSKWLGGFILGLTSLTRPEGALDVAGLIVGATLLGVFRHSPTSRTFKSELKEVAIPTAISASLWVGYLAFRLAYFALPFPHTYYAKSGGGFTLTHLAPLVGDGASAPELLLLPFAAFGLWVMRRDTLILIGLLVSRFVFICVAEEDWMPNTRHFLPLWVVFSIACGATLKSAFRRRKKQWAWRVMATIAVALVSLGWLQVDARYSRFDFRTHGEEETWVRLKSVQGWEDASNALRRIPPAHVAESGPGMLAQVYSLLQADKSPLDEQWYVGRDIGRVGWLVPAKVFDTAGLFTPEVVNSEAWQQNAKPDKALIESALSRNVTASELSGGWERIPSSMRVVYKNQQPWDPYHLVRRSGTPPVTGERVRRMETALAKLPTNYYVMTLYGEAAGAIFERDVGKMRAAYDRNGPVEVTMTPEGLVGASSLEGDIHLLGCTQPTTEVRPGQTVDVACFFRTRRALSSAWTVFVHIEGEDDRFLADHIPHHGLVATNEWRVNRIYRDAFQVHVPARARGEYRMRLGLFSGPRRAKIPGSYDDRVEGPVLNVVPR